MQYFLKKTTIVALFVLAATQHASAFSICLKDNSGATWQLNFTKSDSLLIGRGQVILDDGERVWPAWAFINLKTKIGELHGINPRRSNCSPYLDSFVNFIKGRGGDDVNAGNFFFEGKGYQANYCNGDNLGGSPDFEVGDCEHHSPSALSPSKFINGKQTIPQIKNVIKAIPNPPSNIATISYKLATEGKVSICIYDFLKRPVKVLINNELKPVGNYTVVWDLKNANGSAVPPGVYTIIENIDGQSFTLPLQVVR